MLTRFPQAHIIDLTHEILVHWPAEAGFWLARAYQYFAPGTVHVAVVDPGVGTARSIIVVRAGGHLFVAPDNGLLAPVVSRAPDALIVHLGAAALARLGIHRISATFHGRDIFAPVAAELAAGRVQPEELGEITDTLVPSWVDEPTVEARSVSGVIITQDHFGNLITNIDGALAERFRLPLVHAGNHSFPHAAHLRGDAARGVPRAGELFRGDRDRPRRGQRRGGPRLKPRRPVVVRDRTDQP